MNLFSMSVNLFLGFFFFYLKIFIDNPISLIGLKSVYLILLTLLIFIVVALPCCFYIGV